MGRLVMWNMMTLDGRFEGPAAWALEWHQDAWNDELEQLSIDQLDTAGLLLFGRRTYQGMAAYWSTATGPVAERMNSIPKVVVSRTLERAEWTNTTLVGDEPAAAVADLKARTARDLFVFGSAQLSAALIRAGLFDEYRIGLCPTLLGAGRPLFPPDLDRSRLALLEARPLRSGCVILRYAPAG
jgi:dihydrofolate reductase